MMKVMQQQRQEQEHEEEQEPACCCLTCPRQAIQPALLLLLTVLDWVEAVLT
jgi:hypothetical protein